MLTLVALGLLSKLGEVDGIFAVGHLQISSISQAIGIAQRSKRWLSEDEAVSPQTTPLRPPWITEKEPWADPVPASVTHRRDH